MIIALILAAAAPLPPCPTDVDAPEVAALVSRAQQALQGKSTVATMTMSIKTPSFTRALKMKIQAKGEDYALVRVVSGGPRETGMMTLKREKQLWNWLPQAGRVMKLPSGMLGDSWMGSDFTNDDLVQGTSLSKDFTAQIAGVDGKKAWRVTLVPQKNAVVVWGKIEMTVDRANCLPSEEKFYDEDGKLARTMTFTDVKPVGARLFPMKMTVSSGVGKETSISYDDVAFDVDIPDDTFSVHRLEQGR